MIFLASDQSTRALLSQVLSSTDSRMTTQFLARPYGQGATNLPAQVIAAVGTGKGGTTMVALFARMITHHPRYHC